MLDSDITQRVDDVIEEMLEFGIPLDQAQLFAPLLLPILNDRRGIRAALIDRAPSMALQMGIVSHH